MKGRYSGRHMTVYGHILPKARSIAYSSFLTDKLTERAKYKIKVLDWDRDHGENTSLTARHFGLSRMTVHRWKKQLREYGILGLNERSRRPKRTRESLISPEIVFRVVKIRKEYPSWSKYKIKALLEKEGIDISSSTIGRILKRRGLINKRISQKKRKSALRPKKRFPKGLSISRPGDLIQIDTKYILLTGGRRYYQFTAIDVLTKTRVLRVYPSTSSRNGKKFLKEVVNNLPFSIRAVQTDNGSEFLGFFDKELKRLNIPHYFIYPHSPKQNSYVERSHLSDEKEFYLFRGNISSILEEMQKNILQWEYVWNNIRPHQALGQLTPKEYLQKLLQQKGRIPTRDTIILQA